MSSESLTIFSQKLAERERKRAVSESREVSLLIIYTGGTFGMDSDSAGLLSIKNTGSLFEKMRKLRGFCAGEPDASGLMTSEPFDGCVVRSRVLQFEKLIDSSDSNPEFLILVLKTLEENYSLYDSFLIIHGTDTMEYTASALSFMIKRLTKPIFVTGSQIPLSNVINDAYSNLQGCFRIVGGLTSSTPHPRGVSLLQQAADARQHLHEDRLKQVQRV